MSFLTDLETAVIADFKAAEAEFVKIATDIKPLVIVGAEELATLALNAVATEAPKVLSGSEKFSNAVATVLASLSSSGKSVLVSVAEAAIQIAYNTLSGLLNPPKAS